MLVGLQWRRPRRPQPHHPERVSEGWGHPSQLVPLPLATRQSRHFVALCRRRPLAPGPDDRPRRCLPTHHPPAPPPQRCCLSWRWQGWDRPGHPGPPRGPPGTRPPTWGSQCRRQGRLLAQKHRAPRPPPPPRTTASRPPGGPESESAASRLLQRYVLHVRRGQRGRGVPALALPRPPRKGVVTSWGVTRFHHPGNLARGVCVCLPGLSQQAKGSSSAFQKPIPR
jgi:hypothetical protein